MFLVWMISSTYVTMIEFLKKKPKFGNCYFLTTVSQLKTFKITFLTDETSVLNLFPTTATSSPDINTLQFQRVWKDDFISRPWHEWYRTHNRQFFSHAILSSGVNSQLPISLVSWTVFQLLLLIFWNFDAMLWLKRKLFLMSFFPKTWLFTFKSLWTNDLFL